MSPLRINTYRQFHTPYIVHSYPQPPTLPNTLMTQSCQVSACTYTTKTVHPVTYHPSPTHILSRTTVTSTPSTTVHVTNATSLSNKSRIMLSYMMCAGFRLSLRRLWLRLPLVHRRTCHLMLLGIHHTSYAEHYANGWSKRYVLTSVTRHFKILNPSTSTRALITWRI